MAYNPGIDYHGDQFIAQTGRAISGDITNAIEKYRKNQEQQAGNDMIFGTLQSAKNLDGNPLLTPEEMAKYTSGNLQERNGITSAGMARMAMVNTQKIQQQEQAMKQAQLAQQLQIANLPYNFAPTDADKAAARTTGGELFPTGKGSYHFQPYPDKTGAGGDADNKPIPFVDTATGKPVPNVAYIPKTGQVYPYGDLLTTGGIPTVTDPETGLKFYRDRDGKRHMIKPEDILAAQMLKNTDTSATPTPAPVQPAQGNAPVIGTKVKQNGIVYQFDGTKWNPAQ